ncbi:histidine phosphatase family protein [Streptomyces sp. AV19]|uniref:histidine phosphatase family protein n=1 Tax=Streptomyces sp. AV19 TaxID=2793068 RepID=UPI0024132F43|nr:histidine phosphatase family protein [Streptomyces sp. AV19]MDG4531993.1 histidine phosphatase family protein [Streptomyces sp. AV19]
MVPPERVVAVRHGESTANVLFARARAEGAPVALPPGSDAGVPLSGAGWEQAARVGRWLAGGEVPDVVVVSPYLRARQTWEEMARQVPSRPELRVDERLRDRDMGVFHGLNEIALRERAPEEAARLAEWDHRPPGGESLLDVAGRVRELVGELGGLRVLFVAHDAVVVALRQLFSGERPAVPWPVPNASVSRWVRDGPGLRLIDFGRRPWAGAD